MVGKEDIVMIIALIIQFILICILVALALVCDKTIRKTDEKKADVQQLDNSEYDYGHDVRYDYTDF